MTDMVETEPVDPDRPRANKVSPDFQTSPYGELRDSPLEYLAVLTRLRVRLSARICSAFDTGPLRLRYGDRYRYCYRYRTWIQHRYRRR